MAVVNVVQPDGSFQTVAVAGSADARLALLGSRAAGDAFDAGRDRRPFGTFVHRSVWPAGSAYPDYFMIGDPHTNFYEGKATIDDIKLFVPGT